MEKNIMIDISYKNRPKDNCHQKWRYVQPCLLIGKTLRKCRCTYGQKSKTDYSEYKIITVF